MLIHPLCIAVAPPGFCNWGEVRYGSIGGLEYEVPESRLYCLCINVALCSTALQCICRVIRRSSMTTKAHTHYIIFGTSTHSGEASPPLPPGGATVAISYWHETDVASVCVGVQDEMRCGRHGNADDHCEHVARRCQPRDGRTHRRTRYALRHSLPQFIKTWWRGTAVERRSLTGELSLSCARPVADG